MCMNQDQQEQNEVERDALVWRLQFDAIGRYACIRSADLSESRYLDTLALTRDMISWAEADREIRLPVVKIVVKELGSRLREPLNQIYTERRRN